MTLEDRANEALKDAMRNKDEAAKRTLRSMKTAITVLKTDGSGQEVTPEREFALLQKMVKQRNDSLDIFRKQGREDLAVPEEEELAILKLFMPTMLEGADLDAIISGIIAETGATSAKDMGKVMGAASKALAGKAEGRSISEAVKRLLAGA
jgi:uncharacterized protein